MIHRLSGMSNYFSFFGNDQTISIAGKQIIKQHLAQFTDITGTTQNGSSAIARFLLPMKLFL